MPINFNITFASLDDKLEKTTALMIDEKNDFEPYCKVFDTAAINYLTQAAKAARFVGESRTSMTVYAAPHTSIDELMVIGIGDTKADDEEHWVKLGGYTHTQLARSGSCKASITMDINNFVKGKMNTSIANFAMGILLRSYRFDLYKSKKTLNRSYQTDNTSKNTKLTSITIHCDDPKAAEEAFKRTREIAKGVVLARDLVNQPANILGPAEFAEECLKLSTLGVEVEILDTKKLHEIGMHALLAVAQGSIRSPYVAVMKWFGATSTRNEPICFVGKGVCFDSGGISIKPSMGMEQMKGDMAGAACVTGLMHTLASRKAKINAFGLVGLVENMPSGTAQRPGDIVSSLSGQSIEVLNTDAEGRLVLADLLTYSEKEYAPKIIIDLATLTGAILVALGKEHAGLFSNDDRLADELIASGLNVGEKIWRMPLGQSYNKLIDTPNADMKNTGGRNAGSITAAQFLQRFVTNTPWAHLDIAGTGMASEKNEISQGWASGWGVRILDHYISEYHER